MRIVHLGVGWFPDSAGGLNRYAYEIAHAQARVGHSVTLVVEGPVSVKPTTEGLHVVVPVDASSPLPLRLVRYAWAARRASRNADVIVAHFALLAALPVLLGWLKGPRFVVQFQGPWAEEALASGQSRGQSVRRAIEGFVYRRADVAVVLSDAFRAKLQTYGVPAARIIKEWPGVDTAYFNPARRPGSRSRLGLPPDGRLVVCVRRLVPRMGIDVLLRAWADAKLDDCILVVAGGGPSRQSLESLAENLGIGGSVRFTGRLSDDELADLYAAADLTVVPTLDLEGFGLVVLESLASGTPVIGSDTGGLGEALRGADSTQSVPPGDTEALADALVAWSARGNPNERQNAREWALDAAWPPVADRLGGYEPRPSGALAGSRQRRVRAISPTGEYGGAEHYLLDVLAGLARAGDDVSLLVCGPGPLAIAAHNRGISVLAASSPSERSIKGLANLIFGVRSFVRGSDVVLANHPKAQVLARLATPGSHIVGLLHDPFNRDDRFDRLAKNLVRQKVSASNRAAGGYRSANGRIAVIEPAIDLVSIRRRATTARDDFPVADVVMVARLQTYKGVFDFLDVAQMLHSTHPSVSFSLIGPDAPSEPDLRARLNRQIAERHLDGTVTLTGPASDLDVARSLSAAKVFVHAAHEESFGIAVLEALALGVAVVSYATSGPSRICGDEAGVLIPVGDIAGLAKAVAGFIDDPQRRAEQSERGQARAEAFGMTNFADTWRRHLTGKAPERVS